MFFSKETYKDDYFKNLSFIKAMTKKQSSILTMAKQVPNKQLLRILIVDGEYPAYNGEKTPLEIEKILVAMANFLNKNEPVIGGNEEDNEKKILSSFLQQNEVDFRPLSMTQLNSSLKMQTYLKKREYNGALRELANCIEDSGKGLNMDKCISVNEYALYINLVTEFLNYLSQEQI